MSETTTSEAVAQINQDPTPEDLPIVERMKGGGGSVGQYQDVFVGSRSWFALIWYELVFGLFAATPGALGYLLRKTFFPTMLGASGRGVLFGNRMTVRNPRCIHLGDHVALDDNTVLDAKGEAGSGIRAGSNVWVGRGTILTCYNGTITLGDDVSIGPSVNLASHASIEIGSHVAIGTGCSVLAGGHEFEDPNVPMLEQKRTAIGVCIEDNVWLGTGAVILDGVTIGTGAIIGTGAVVNKDVPPMSVVMGNPARVVQKRGSTKK